MISLKKRGLSRKKFRECEDHMSGEKVLVTTYAVPKAKLAALPDDARGLVFMLCHIANELTTIDRLLQFAMNFEEPKDAIGRVHLSQALLLTRVLVGKEWEAWEFMRAILLGTPLGKTYVPLLTDEAKSALEQLKKYFGKKSLLDVVRNHFAFHYLTENWCERLTGSFRKIEEGDCEFYISEKRLNTHWWGAEVVLNYTLLESIETDQPAEANRRLGEEASKVFEWLYDVCDHAIPTILKYHDSLGTKKGAISINNPPSRKQVRLPVILSTRPPED